MNTDKQLNWQPIAEERFVLYLDIMGFKERVKSTDVGKLYKSLQHFTTNMIQGELLPLREGGKTGNKLLMEMAQFSDSIVVVSANNTKEDLNRITKASAILMRTALENGFAIRGVISCGEMVFDKKQQLFFGKALVDAYLLEQEMCHYGIIFHHTTESIVREVVDEMNTKGEVATSNSSIKSRYIPIGDCLVKLKNGKSKHYQVLWHQMGRNKNKDDISEEAKEWLVKLRETVSGNPRVYLDNTLDFINNELVKFDYNKQKCDGSSECN